MKSLFENDLKKLNTLYHRVQFSFVFLYGRYGTGKTSFIREFCAGKTAVLYSAQETVSGQQLDAFYRESVRCLNLKRTTPVFESWKQAFSLLSDFSFSHRLILVLDEFQYLAWNCPDFMEAFTHAVSTCFQSGKIFLIISSSSLDYAGQLLQEPLSHPFDAVTAKASFGALPFYVCQPLLSGFTPKEQLLLYGVTGGILSCLKKLQPKLSAARNIQELFFRNDSPFLSAPADELHRELREISTYNYLLEIIASGCSRLTDIAARASVGTNKCAKYLSVLISHGLIRKESPAIGEIHKKVQYFFTDHMTRFWYRFVSPSLSAILFGQGAQILERQVLPELDKFLLPVFENICAEYLERLAGTGQTPFVYHHAGSWWTGGTKREPFFRIPLVAADEQHAVLGVCHTAKTPAGTDLLDPLFGSLEAFGGLTRYYCVFSTSGFTPELEAAARQEKNVWLVDLEDICGNP